jgi:hypothetical protein
MYLSAHTIQFAVGSFGGNRRFNMSAINYKNFTLNSSGDTAPWSDLEVQFHKDIINTVVGDAVTVGMDTTGHKHPRLYSDTSTIVLEGSSNEICVPTGITVRVGSDCTISSDSSSNLEIWSTGDIHMLSDIEMAQNKIIKSDTGTLTICGDGINLQKIAGGYPDVFFYEDNMYLRASSTTNVIFDDDAGVCKITPSAQNLQLYSEAPGATGPAIQIFQKSASPAASDWPGAIEIYGNNAAWEQTRYLSVQSKITATNDGTERSEAYFTVLYNGGYVSCLILDGFESTIQTGLYVLDAKDVRFGTTTGTKLGTGATEKIGVWGKTPIVQPVLATGAGHVVDDVITVLQNIGWCKQS